MMMRFSEIKLQLPPWVEGFVGDPTKVYRTVEERMQFVIGLSDLNVRHGTGGPFGAAIFDSGTSRLISVGVNVVVKSHCSVAHAEMMAIMLAQQSLGSHDLGSSTVPACELVTSAEPCAMCLGAIPWSGVRRLVCAARKEDVSSIGFDEGSRPSDWIAQLNMRGVDVASDVCREQAVAVLRNYLAIGGTLYNSSSNDVVSTHQT